jgi:hypothetical protein
VHSGHTLTDFVRLWPTPEASDGSGGRVSKELGGTRPSGAKRAITLATAVAHAERERFPTPTVSDSKGPSPNLKREGSPNLAERIMWPTPKSSPSGPDFARMNRPRSGGDDLATAVARTVGGPLNPTWVEWLMGFPIGWTVFDHSEMPSYRKSRKRSAGGSSRSRRRNDD